METKWDGGSQGRGRGEWELFREQFQFCKMILEMDVGDGSTTM